MTDSDTNKSLEEFKEKHKKEGEKIVFEKFPSKVKQLNDLISSGKFDMNRLSAIAADVNIPIPPPKSSADIESEDSSTAALYARQALDKRVFLFPNGLEKCNQNITELIETMKPLLLDFVKDLQLLEFAITLMMPKIEDGNDFGVRIQRQAVNCIKSAENTTQYRLKQIGIYYRIRGFMLTEIAKYPHIQDYRRALREEEESAYVTVCLAVRELLESYARIHDLICKNLEKIKKPKGEQEFSMY